MILLAGFRLALHTEHYNYGLNIITGHRPERKPHDTFVSITGVSCNIIYYERGWSSPYGAAHTLQGLTAAPGALIGICGGRMEAHLLCCPINRAENSRREQAGRRAGANLHQMMDRLLFLHGGNQTFLQPNIKVQGIWISRNKHTEEIITQIKNRLNINMAVCSEWISSVSETVGNSSIWQKVYFLWPKYILNIYQIYVVSCEAQWNIFSK